MESEGMDRNNGKSKRQTESQLFRLMNRGSIDLDFISAVAGDRPLTEAENEKLTRLLKRRGDALFSDMIFRLTSELYTPDTAREVWGEIVRHKRQLEKQLGRNAGMPVAALDYLLNIRRSLENPTVIDSSKMEGIAEVALKDGLTNLYDFAAFKEKLAVEIQRYHRHADSLSLIMMDLDDFKVLNDELGHQWGDKVLARVAMVIRKAIRELDIPARYGGEEFAVILPQTDLDEACFVAERIRLSVKELDFKKRNITISLGISSCPIHATTAEELIRKADDALYESKRRGKNRTSVCS
jgi:diguanylate cyclase (GGDEF)-like protein